jgi:hypothetical protein
MSRMGGSSSFAFTSTSLSTAISGSHGASDGGAEICGLGSCRWARR